MQLVAIFNIVYALILVAKFKFNVTKLKIKLGFSRIKTYVFAAKLLIKMDYRVAQIRVAILPHLTLESNHSFYIISRQQYG
ncbi:hypothetical protein EGI20_03950 [Aquitalea sp. S1-19]|nr:hypothetical protein [Aquitalea sp. S1-19]